MNRLLQVSYLTENNPVMGTLILVVVALLIISMVIVNVVKNGINMNGLSRTPRRFSRWALHRTANLYGLSRDEAALLEGIFRKDQVTDPQSTMSNLPLLDKYFKKAFFDIEKHSDTEASADYQKALLFAIRGAAEAAQNAAVRSISTRKLSDGLAATLATPQGENYPVRVLSAKGDYLIIGAPKSALGTPITFSKGDKVGLSFYSKTSQGYRFETRVASTSSTPSGPIINLNHQDRLSSLPTRQHRRKEVQMSAFFAHVTIEERTVGRRVEKKTVVNDRRSLGTILDLSAGGCALKTAAPIHTGEYVKVEFDDIQGKTMAALARIVRTNRSGQIGGIMHLQFIKTPRRTANAIHAVIYGYEPD